MIKVQFSKIDFSNCFFKALVALLILGIVACGSRPVVPVSEIDTLSSAREIDRMGGRLVRIVQKGDTLHAIAFESGLSIKDLAIWNGLNQTSRIITGQRLRLTKPRVLPTTAPKIGSGKSPRVASSNIPDEVTSNSARSSTNNKNFQVERVPRSSAKSPTSKPPLATKAKIQKASKLNWVWPTKGQVIKRFNPKGGQQGIDIKGNKGQSIFSVLDGEVVYAGNGLKGYGNLIIIQHQNDMLSAYAHTEAYFVKEGQIVRRNDKIAIIGIDYRNNFMLHFQIRKDGVPVNPTSYLP